MKEQIQNRDRTFGSRSSNVDTPGNGDIMRGRLERSRISASARLVSRPVANLRLLWENRRFLGRVTGAGLLLSVAHGLSHPQPL